MKKLLRGPATSDWLEGLAIGFLLGTAFGIAILLPWLVGHL